MRCDFNTGFQAPEMIKRRPVLSVSKRRTDGAPICTVIPISSQTPETLRDYHYKLPDEEMPHILRNGNDNWLKIDMVTTVAFFRLDLLWHGRDAHGKRVYESSPISLEHQVEISSRLEGYISFKNLEK